MPHTVNIVSQFHTTLHRFFFYKLDKGFSSFFFPFFWHPSKIYLFLFCVCFGDFTGCLPVCGQLLLVCCLSCLRIFVAKDKILACKMFEIKSDRWHGIFFVVEIFLIYFFSLFNCIKVSFFGNFLSFCKTWLFFTQIFLLLGLTFISKFLGF